MSGILILKLLVMSFAIINAMVLVVKGSTGRIRNYFLGWSLLCYSLYFLVFILWYEMGFILDYPHLMRTGSPIGFLAAPFFYFFVRNNVKGWSGFQKWDWVHFLPALLHILDLIPFFLLSEEVKLDLARQILSSPFQLDVLVSGWIPPSVIIGVRLFLMLGYFIWSCLILIQHRPFEAAVLKKPFNQNWLMLAVLLVGGINLAYFIFRIGFLTGYADVGYFAEIQTFAGYLILICTVILSLYIHAKQELVFEPVERESNLNESYGIIPSLVLDNNSSFIPKDMVDYESLEERLDPNIRDRIVSFFEEEEGFKKKGLLVSDLAKRLGISVRELPLYIRHYFDSDFKTMVNDYRVCLAKKMIEEGYLDDYTLEALGEYCGYCSRTTFFNAFKKKYGTSPSDFWKAFQKMS